MYFFQFIRLSLIIILGNACYGTSQINPNKLNVGDSIYIITNRDYNSNNLVTPFTNKLSKNKNLYFVKAKVDSCYNFINKLLTYENFMLEISESPSDWLVFIHGDSKTYKQSVKRGFDIQNTHKINVIVFSWPSEIPSLSAIKNLKNSQQNVLKSHDNFIDILVIMKEFRKSNNSFNQDKKLSLLSHSLGNLYLEQLISNSAYNLKNEYLFDNIIMNSAAVKEKHHINWVEKLNIQKRIYIASNKSDFTLKGKHLFTKGGNQLGEKIKRNKACNAEYISFSKAVGFRFPIGTTHTYFIGSITEKSKNIHYFYSQIFHGSDIDLSSEPIFIKRPKHIYYSITF